MENRVLVYSRNQFFIDSFSIYTRDHRQMNIFFFSDRCLAEKWLGEQRVDIVLAERDFLEEVSLPGKAVKVCISERTRVSAENGICACNIYQRGADILADLTKIISAAGGGAVAEGDSPSRVAAFYSPQGGSGKTTLAYSCAMLCARKGTTIYLNLEEFGYTGHLYQTESGIGMEEILFSLKDGRDARDYVCDAVRKNRHNVYVMPDLKAIGDFHDMSGEDVEKMVRQLQSVMNCDFLILDLSGGFNERNQKLLEMSNVGFWVFSDDQVGRGKMERVRNDQSIKDMEIFGKTYFLLNKSRENVQDSDAVRIPFSESLSKGREIETVMSGNESFLQKCNDLAALAEGTAVRANR